MKKTMFFIAAAVLLTGCTNVARFDYNAAQGTTAAFQDAGAGAGTIAVPPFLDQRGTTHPVGDHGSFYLGFIPLMPFGYVGMDEPEKSEDFVSLGWFHFNPQVDLADSAAMSLKASNLFADVKRVGNVNQADSDYIWRGIVTNTCYSGYMYSYCITYLLSPVLWVLGAPSGTSVNELWVRFELIERKSGKAVWNYEYRGSDCINHWIYARVGKDTSLYAQMMKQAMNGALLDLSQKLPALGQ